MKPEIFGTGVQKPFKQQRRKKLGVGDNAHHQILIFTESQRFFKVGHWINGINDQFIFNRKAPNMLEIIDFKNPVPDLVDFDFRIINARLSKLLMFIFDCVMQLIDKIPGILGNIKFEKQSFYLFGFKCSFFRKADITRFADKQGTVDIKQNTLNRLR